MHRFRPERIPLTTHLVLLLGDADPLGADNVSLDEALTRLGIEHGFEEYEGDHTSRVGERFEMKVLPFFSRRLGVD